MSCTSPLTVASTIVPLPSESAFSMCGSRCATAVFITSAEVSTKGNCMAPEPNNSPTVFMPASKRVVDDLQRAARVQGLVEIGLQPVALAVDDPPLQTLVQAAAPPVRRRVVSLPPLAVAPSNSSSSRFSGS